MAKELQVRKGALLLWRLGNLEFGEQSRWSRAPENKGMWAFPWPYYETFLTFHQYRDRLPKRLKSVERSWWPASLEWYTYPDGSTPTEIERGEYGEPLDEAIELREGFSDAQDEWYRTVGKRILPLRKFWYSGELYTHIDKKGRIGNPGTMGGTLETTDWFRMDASEAAVAIRRARGDRFIQRPQEPGQGLSVWRASHDHLELFIPSRSGKITSEPR